MNDIDDRLTRAGQAWREDAVPAPTVDIDRLVGIRPARNLAWFTIATASIAAALVFALWRGLPPQPISPGASSTPGASFVAGTSPTPSIAPTPAPLGSQTSHPSYPPGVGVLHLEGDPSAVAYRVEITYSGPKGDLAGVDTFEPGEAVIVDRPFPADFITIRVNGFSCGAVDHYADVEVDVTLHLGADATVGCEAVGFLTHSIGGVQHPMEGALIGAVVWEGAIVRVRSLDPAHADEAPVNLLAGPGGVEGWEFPIGPYEVSALLDGELLGTETIDLTPDGGGLVLNFMILPRDVPRDCGSHDPDLCERIINAALAYNHGGVMADDTVVAVRVHDTEVRSCGYGIEAPLYDVEIHLPDGLFDVTVGNFKDGRLMACTY